MLDDPKSDDALYDLVPDEPAPPRAPIPVSPAPPPVTSTTSPLNYRNAPTAPARADTEIIKNLYMPMWLLGAGVVIEVVAAILRAKNWQFAMLEVGLGLVFGTIFMLAGILIAARIRQIDLGNFWNAVFKLAAISVAPSAVVTLFSPLLRRVPLAGGLLGLIGEFILYFALLGALFDLDESDTWYCVMVIFLVRLAVFFGLMFTAGKWV